MIFCVHNQKKKYKYKLEQKKQKHWTEIVQHFHTNFESMNGQHNGNDTIGKTNGRNKQRTSHEQRPRDRS